jgi:cytochrome c-type biogenesis protein CcmH
VSLVPYILALVLALMAIGFAGFGLWRGWDRKKALLLGAIALFLLGVGGGTYVMVGAPGLALRAAQGENVKDVRGLVPMLIQRVRKEPRDWQAWIYLGRAYFTVNDYADAAKAYGRGIAVMRSAHMAAGPEESMYGQLLVAINGGQVSQEAQTAFINALRANPRDPAARFYLGDALAAQGNRDGALQMWQSLLAEVPETSPIHQKLVDRIALLTASGLKPGGGAPDPRAMVAGLAARLAQNPDDPAGWQRLIKAYTVLGETDKAKEALATARKTFAGKPELLTPLDAEAKDLKLD